MIHYSVYGGTRLVVYQDGEPLGHVSEPGHARALACALLLGQGLIGGVPVPNERTRLGIAAAALQVAQKGL